MKLNQASFSRMEGGEFGKFVYLLQGLCQQAEAVNSTISGMTFTFLVDNDDKEVGEYVPEIIMRVRKLTQDDVS